MNNDPSKAVLSIAVLVMALLVLSASAAEVGSRSATANPDFTMGGQVPEGATHDWNLGPT